MHSCRNICTGNNSSAVGMYTCTLCMRKCVCIGEGMVEELHVGDVCTVCEVYGVYDAHAWVVCVVFIS